MRNSFYLFLLLIGVLAWAAPEARAQNRNSITGFVFDESRRPVAQIYVELQDGFYSTVARLRTGGSGMYSFRNLAPGQYAVRILTVGSGYEEQVKTVSLVPISTVEGRGAISEQVDFYLKAKKNPGSTPSGPPAVVFAQEIPSEAKSLYEAGVENLNNKSEEGLVKLRRAIEIFPDYYLALDRLGLEYVGRGHYEAAYALLTKALSVNPRSSSSALGLGVTEFRLGNNARAVDWFNDAVRLDQTSPNAHIWLGIALHKKQDLSGALKSLLEANKLSGGTNAEVHWQLARVYKDQKKYAKAADELEIFLQLRPDAQNAEEIKKIVRTLREKK